MSKSCTMPIVGISVGAKSTKIIKLVTIELFCLTIVYDRYCFLFILFTKNTVRKVHFDIYITVLCQGSFLILNSNVAVHF